MKAKERERAKERYFHAFKREERDTDTQDHIDWWLNEMNKIDLKIMNGTYGKK